MRYQYRVTKFDPKNRNDQGHYLADEWTSISDIGKSFRGRTFSKENYEQVESSYLFAIETFLAKSDIATLCIKSLEQRAEQFNFKLGAALGIGEILEISRLALREKLWCRLANPGQAYIHFGRDYYMNVGVPRLCTEAILAVELKGLFVEPHRSPYLRARNNC